MFGESTHELTREHDYDMVPLKKKEFSDAGRGGVMLRLNLGQGGVMLKS